MKKTPIERLVRNKIYKEYFGDEEGVLSESVMKELNAWFEEYPNVRRGGDWFLQLCHWIRYEQTDFVQRRKKMESLGKYRINLENYILRYGEVEGPKKYDIFNQKRASKSIFHDSDRQREFSLRSLEKRLPNIRSYSGRCVEYYVKKGLSQEDAEEAVSNAQKRDINFFVNRYGEDEGNRRFNESKMRRRKTWETKDKDEHAAKTGNDTKKWGQEGKAIAGFIEQNKHLWNDNYFFKHGPTKQQLNINIPGVGVRRYDLAIYDENRKLKYVVEFHGPHHTNFSEYDPALKDELIRDRKTGKLLPYNKTYGEIYANDMAKRRYIEENHPDVLYLVIWVHDLKKRKFDIEYLQMSTKDRLSS